MPLTVTMPQLGESVTEGTIARWLKHPGDPVAKYESIAEVVTDKVNAEIPAPADGTMTELIASEGAVVAVGEPICSIETGAAAGTEAAPTASPAAAAAAQPASAAPAPAPAPESASAPAPAQQPASTRPGASAAPAPAQPVPNAEAQPEPAGEPQPVATNGFAGYHL